MATVLLVEDEPAVRLGVRLALERAGYRVLEAALAQEAWNLLKEAEVVVLDWMLPDEPGTRLLERMRQGPYPHLPVLMLTARAEVRDRVEGLSRGADDYLVKPFATEELLARLEALLRRAGKRKVLKGGPSSWTWSAWRRAWKGGPFPSPGGSLNSWPFWQAAQAGSTPGRSFWRPCGARTSWAPPGPWTSTSSSCGKNSGKTPRPPLPGDGAGVGYRFKEAGEG